MKSNMPTPIAPIEDIPDNQPTPIAPVEPSDIPDNQPTPIAPVEPVVKNKYLN
jgi:hypothetical protein